MNRNGVIVALVLLLVTPARATTPSNGWVVWASNRKDGRHEIYLMKSDGTGVKRLTFNGAQFPGWSPNAKWIAYTNAADTSTHVMRWTGLGDKKVCDGKFEFWMWDGSGLVCRVVDDHYLVNADTGSKTLLFKKSDFTKIGSKALNPGGISHDGRYLVAHSDIFRSGYTASNGSFTAYHAAVVLDFQNKSNIYFFGSGCEPTTPPSGNRVYHVCGGGPCTTFPDPYRMDLSDLATRSSYAAEIAHANSDWGHEYFPRVSNDNKWLAYAATTGCHDQDTCDYEIHIHKLGAENSDRTRITTDPANDQWPHLWVGTLPSVCSVSSDCDDSDACTTNSCASTQCVYTAISGCCTNASDCDDANACTTDTCSANKCAHSTVADCCTKNAECDDADPCTADTCSANACKNASISGCCTKASQCSDGNPCITYACTDNKCAQTPVADCCSDSGDCDDANPCTTDSCESASGKCGNEQQSGCCTFDTDCNDSDPCTLDTCDETTHDCLHSASCTPDAGPEVVDGGVVDGGVPDSRRPLAEGGHADQTKGDESAYPTSSRLEGGCSIGSSSCPDWVALLLLFAWWGWIRCRVRSRSRRVF